MLSCVADQKLCSINYHITFLAAGSYAVTCKTHNINVVVSPVEFVPKINCCGVNCCRHTSPNIALKIKFDGYQKVGNFQAQHLYFSLQNLCLIDYYITFFAAGSYAVTCRTHNIKVVASPVQFVPKIIVAVLIFADIQIQTLR